MDASKREVEDKEVEADDSNCQRRSRESPDDNEDYEVSSEASTEVGPDEDLEEDCDALTVCNLNPTHHAASSRGPADEDECEEDADADDASHLVGALQIRRRPLEGDRTEVASVETPSKPPRFSKVCRGQRLAQLARILEEYCTLDFDEVDASAQSAVVLRMLALMRSLRQKDVYHDRDGARCTEERFALLGLAAEGQEMTVIDKLGRQAEALIEGRSFRPAFELLCEARPLFVRCCQDVGIACGTPLDEEQAMALRRWLRKQRQREERRNQRASDRSLKTCRNSAEAQPSEKAAEVRKVKCSRQRPNKSEQRSHPRT